MIYYKYNFIIIEQSKKIWMQIERSEADKIWQTKFEKILDDDERSEAERKGRKNNGQNSKNNSGRIKHKNNTSRKHNKINR